MIENLLKDIITNPLFLSFAVIEVVIFIAGLFFIKKGFNQSTAVSYIGNKLKLFFEKIESDENPEKLDHSSKDKLTNTILKLIQNTKEEEIGIDREQILRVLRFEYEKPYSIARMLINILPVIGLIGTFLGITIAVYELKFSGDISQIARAIENNLKALDPFLIGIRFAFFSTILALILALLLRIVLEISSTRSRNIIESFQNFFSVQLSEYIKPAGTAEKIAKSVSSFSRRVSRLSGEIEKSLNRIVDSFTKQSEGQGLLLDKRLSNLKSIEESMLANLGRLWGNISETLEKMREQIFVATTNYTKASDDALLLLAKLEDLVRNSTDITEKQSENATKIGQAVRKLTEDSDKVTIKIEELLTPMKDVSDKYEKVLEKTLEFNKPFEDTNKELKAKFENLIKSINEIEIKNTGLLEKVKLYADSLESNLGVKFDNILNKENQIQTLVDNTLDVQKKFETSIDNLKNYSSDLNKASTILVENISVELKKLFVNITQRQDISVNVLNTNGVGDKIESLIKIQNKSIEGISETLAYLDDTLRQLTYYFNLPIFSWRRWFGNGRNKSRAVIQKQNRNKVFEKK